MWNYLKTLPLLVVSVPITTVINYKSSIFVNDLFNIFLFYRMKILNYLCWQVLNKYSKFERFVNRKRIIFVPKYLAEECPIKAKMSKMAMLVRAVSTFEPKMWSTVGKLQSKPIDILQFVAAECHRWQGWLWMSEESRKEIPFLQKHTVQWLLAGGILCNYGGTFLSATFKFRPITDGEEADCSRIV